jgi:OmpA-OmpF porin, OOP family
MKLPSTLCFGLYLLTGTLPAQQSKQYNNGHGGKITLPLGDVSFADKVVSYRPGNPAPLATHAIPEKAIGVADFNEMQVSGFVSLGIGGELVLAFTDNALINTEGPDLFVFEVGKYVEETYLYVSKDGRKWKNTGKIGGGNVLVDIGDSTLPGEIFTYVKLVDAGTTAKKGDLKWPGADIDAVAAIGSARQLSFNAIYLFNTGESKLKPGAKQQLDTIMKELKTYEGFNIVVNGHTDSTGSLKLNQKLSLDRANAVKNYIVSKLPAMKTRILTLGYAGDQPVAENTTAEGRERNRRVEVFLVPAKK